MRLICLVMHFVVSKILKYAPQTFLRFDSNVPPQIQNSLLFMVHIHMIYTGFTHFCREISLVAITRFGRHFLAKIGGRRHKNIFKDRAAAPPVSFCFSALVSQHQPEVFERQLLKRPSVLIVSAEFLASTVVLSK